MSDQTTEQAAREKALYDRLFATLRTTGYMTRDQCHDCVELIITELKKAANEN